MKLSFSTKGWESISWAQFCDKAEELGFKGIEIHDMNHPAFTGKNAVFDQAMLRAPPYDIMSSFACIPEVRPNGSSACPEGEMRLYTHTKIHEEGGNEACQPLTSL